MATEPRWTPLPMPPDGVPTFCSTVVVGAVFVLAGGERLPSSSGGTYDTRTKSWTPLPDEAIVWSYASTTSTGDSAFFWGGYGDATPVAAEFFPKENRWAEVPPAPIDPLRSYAATASDHEHVLVFGGERVVGPERFPADAALYSRSARAWRVVAVPWVRSRAFALWTGLEFVVGGGYGEESDQLIAAYDPHDEKWRYLAPAPSTGLCAAAANDDGTAILAWGIDGAAYRYDSQADQWEQLSAGIPEGTYLGYSSTAWSREGLYALSAVAGGCDRLLRWELASARWQVIGPTPFVTFGEASSLRVVDDQLIAVFVLEQDQRGSYDHRRWGSGIATCSLAAT